MSLFVPNRHRSRQDAGLGAARRALRARARARLLEAGRLRRRTERTGPGCRAGAGAGTRRATCSPTRSRRTGARREGESIELERIGARWRELSSVFRARASWSRGRRAAVPLDDAGALPPTDRVLRLPVLLVARSTLAPSTTPALARGAARRDLAVAGVVLCGRATRRTGRRSSAGRSRGDRRVPHLRSQPGHGRARRAELDPAARCALAGARELNGGALDWLELDRRHVCTPIRRCSGGSRAAGVAGRALAGARRRRRMFDGISSWWVNLHARHRRSRAPWPISGALEHSSSPASRTTGRAPGGRAGAARAGGCRASLLRRRLDRGRGGDEDGGPAWRHRGEARRTCSWRSRALPRRHLRGDAAAPAVFHGAFADLRARSGACRSRAAARSRRAGGSSRARARAGRIARCWSSRSSGRRGMRIHPPEFSPRSAPRRAARIFLVADEVSRLRAHGACSRASTPASCRLICLSKG